MAGKRRTVVAGWSRRRFVVDDPRPVLDLGSGAFPNPAADVLCDGSLVDDRHRHGLGAVVDRPFVVARAEALPFADRCFSFAIASHIAEHVEDPDGLCRELARVATSGYIETPSPLCDVLLDEEYHIWRVSQRGGVLRFTSKRPQPAWLARLTTVFYKGFNAGRCCARPTWSLPPGPVGRAVGFGLKVIAAVLARLGILHTRYPFGPDRPLRWEVVRRDPITSRRRRRARTGRGDTAGARPRVAFVDRPPASGFVRVDRAALAERFDVVDLRYPGWPAPRFLVDSLRAARSCVAVYGFFASEHLVVPATLFRLAGRRVVVTTGGYDTADDRVHGYGLAATGKGWLPRLVLRLATAVLPMSTGAGAELARLAPRAVAKARITPLAIDPAEWPDPGVARRCDLVVTVGYVGEESWSRKGIDRFVAAAVADPARRYVLAGRVDPAVADRLAGAPDNLEVTGPTAQADLNRLLWSAGVYAQLSWHEGFGVAVAEAMLCGCVPLVTDLPALREVTGAYAVVVDGDEHDLGAVERAVQRATDAATDRPTMRADIAGRFSRTARAVALAQAVLGQEDAPVAGATVSPRGRRAPAE